MLYGLGICMGKHFRILPDLIRGPYDQTQSECLLSSNMSPGPTQAPILFIPLRLKPDLFTMCPDYRIINTYFFQRINTINP